MLLHCVGTDLWGRVGLGARVAQVEIGRPVLVWAGRQV